MDRESRIPLSWVSISSEGRDLHEKIKYLNGCCPVMDMPRENRNEILRLIKMVDTCEFVKRPTAMMEGLVDDLIELVPDRGREFTWRSRV